jgi:hypothetical protein
MLRPVLILASAVVLLAVGAMTAAAGNRHGNSAGQTTGAGAVTTLTTGAMLEVKAQDDEARAQEAVLDAAKAQAAAAAAQAQAQTQAQAETDSDTADEATDEDANDAADEAAPATNNEQNGAEHDD